MKIAHISDIHFFHLNKNPLQFFSKRVLGNFHYFFGRRKHHDSSLAYKILPMLKKQGVTHLVISGDYTCTASAQEFQKMQDYIKAVKREGFEVFTLPGNHDAYTKSSYRNQSFFSYLGDLVSFKGDTSHNLIDHHVAAFKLKESWWLALVNCSFPTPWVKSTGIFSPEVEKQLNHLLQSIPSDAKIILTCHYPFEHFKYPSAHLERGDFLEKIVTADSRIRLYLHGHRHLHRIERRGNLTIADSGSISLKKSSSFNLIELKQDNFIIRKGHVNLV